MQSTVRISKFKKTKFIQKSMLKNSSIFSLIIILWLALFSNNISAQPANKAKCGEARPGCVMKIVRVVVSRWVEVCPGDDNWTDADRRQILREQRLKKRMAYRRRHGRY